MRCPLVYLTKLMGGLTVDQMIARGRQIGCEGFDLACRPGQTITPENLKTLPDVARELELAGFPIAMVTADGGLTDPANPTAEPILAAMQTSGIKLLKLGYFSINNQTDDYWEKVADARNRMEGWARLGERYEVRICYHTHSSGEYLGINAAAVMHLLSGLDPRWIGAYLDSGHQHLDGEPPDVAFNMVADFVAIVGAKDARKDPDNLEAGYRYTYCRAGRGDVDWQRYFENLRRVSFRGPISVHALHERYMPSYLQGDKEPYFASLRAEFDFFRQYRDALLGSEKGQ